MKALKNGHFWRPKKGIIWPQKKDIPRIHIGMDFLQKTGSKLVKFGPWGPIYILPGHIGGRHPVPCLSTQISERQGTAMYYFYNLSCPEWRDKHGTVQKWTMVGFNAKTSCYCCGCGVYTCIRLLTSTESFLNFKNPYQHLSTFLDNFVFRVRNIDFYKFLKNLGF